MDTISARYGDDPFSFYTEETKFPSTEAKQEQPKSKTSISSFSKKIFSKNPKDNEVIKEKISKGDYLKKLFHLSVSTPSVSSPLILSQKNEPASLGENPAKRVCGNIHRNWGQGSISKSLAMKKMKKNLVKAKKEHFKAYEASRKRIGKSESKTDDKTSNPYEFSIPYKLKSVKPLKLQTGSCQTQGPRPSMDDAHFSIPLPGGILLGVLDGHGDGGKAIANFISHRFQQLFQSTLDKNDNNVHQTFEEIAKVIQTEIVEIRSFDHIGSTAVVCYIQKSTNCIYTATLGDSEANIYRQCKSIPLSCVRDWASHRDEQRASLSTEGEFVKPLQEFWKDAHFPSKHRRVNSKGSDKLVEEIDISEALHYGSNVSRAFGDHEVNKGREIDAIIAKFKITACRLKRGDILVLACDGLKDYVDEKLIVENITLNSFGSANDISKELINLAIRNRTKDNVTVVTVKVN